MTVAEIFTSVDRSHFIRRGQKHFRLFERVAGARYELASRVEILRQIASHGSRVVIEAPLTLYYYVGIEDEWLSAIIRKGTVIELTGPRPNVMPPFSSVQNFLQALGPRLLPADKYLRGYFEKAKKEGKFPWVQEPYEIYVPSIGLRGFTPLLELLYAIEPESFTQLEHIRFSAEYLARLLMEGYVCLI